MYLLEAGSADAITTADTRVRRRPQLDLAVPERRGTVGVPLPKTKTSDAEGPAFAQNCTVQCVDFDLESGPWRIYVDERSSLMIKTYDKDGQEKRVGGERFVAKLRGPAKYLPLVVDLGNGRYRVEFVCFTSGNFELVLLLYGEPVAGTPVAIEAWMPRPDVSKCRVALCAPHHDTAQVRAGMASTFELTLIDPVGKPAPSQDLEVAIYPIWLNMKSGVERSAFERQPPRAWDRKKAADKARFSFSGLAESAHPATFKGGFRAERAGMYALHVSLKHPFTPLPGSPMLLNIVPGDADASRSSLPLDVASMSESVVGQMGGFLFHTYDAFGNRCTSGGAGILALVDGGGAKCTTWVNDMSNGSYEVKWYGEEPGEYTVRVSLGATHGIPDPKTEGKGE